MSNPEAQEVLQMTAQTIGRDILQALVQEVKLLPDVWPKLSEVKQNDVIDRLRKRVDHNVKMAVHLIASDGRTVVVGDLDQITIKDGVKAVVKFSSTAANLHELYEAGGKSVLVVVAAPDAHTGGMDEVRGESDQRAMDLGTEYDPNGDGKGMPGEEGGVVDVDAKMLPDTPLQEQLDETEEEGYQAAADGKPESACPLLRGELCIAWVKGWKRYHELNPSDAPAQAQAQPQAEPTPEDRDNAWNDGYDAAEAELPREVPERITNEMLRAEWLDGYDECAGPPAAPASGTPAPAPDSTGPNGRAIPKYRNPQTGETWSGRGKKPKWLEVELGRGRKLEDFLADTQEGDGRAAA